MRRRKNDRLEHLLDRARREEKKKKSSEVSWVTGQQRKLDSDSLSGWSIGEYIFFWLANFLLVLCLLYLITGDGLTFLANLLLP
ncbi:MAG: hypothetical protein UMV23_05865 [Halanaerobium sp.]|nr:hypothetical protein [Halanaerobium sp.]